LSPVFFALSVSAKQAAAEKQNTAENKTRARGVQFRMESSLVMRGLDPRIHLLEEEWIAGSSPATTS